MRRRKPHIPEDATALEIIKSIDNWAKKARNECALDFMKQKEYKRLWNVLTALRGPDNEDGDLKDRTTAVIRHHSLPNLAFLSGAIVREGSLEKLAATLDDMSAFDHFHSHIEWARTALQSEE